MQDRILSLCGNMWCVAQFGTILCNFKNVKNTHGGVLLLIKLQASTCNFIKVTLLHGCFSRILNCANGTKSRKASHIRVRENQYSSIFYILYSRYGMWYVSIVVWVWGKHLDVVDCLFACFCISLVIYIGWTTKILYWSYAQHSESFW